MSSDELDRLRDRQRRGEPVCPELVAPRVEITAEGVSLDGQRLVGDPRSISISSFQPLFDELRRGRETWTMLHPGEVFTPTITIVAAPETGAVTGARIVGTAALAGYSKVEVRSNDIVLGFDHRPPPAAPPAPRADPQAPTAPWGREIDAPTSAAAAPPEELRLARAAAAGQVQVRFSGRPTPRVGLDETIESAQLAQLLEKECARGGEPCVETIVVEVGDFPFHEGVRLARAASTAAPLSSRRVQLAFEMPKAIAAVAPAATAQPAPAATGKPSTKQKVRFGALAATGPLPLEAIEKVVKTKEPELRDCYRRALPGNRELQGRVGVRFVIGRDGSVFSPANGGSDLPDAAVVTCVVGVYRDMRFPRPTDNTVTVFSPVVFSPD